MYKTFCWNLVNTYCRPSEDLNKKNDIIQHFLSRKSGSRALSQRKCEICAMSWLRILSHSGCASGNVKAAYYLILITKHPPQSLKLRKAKWKQVGPLYWAEPCRVFFPLRALQCRRCSLREKTFSPSSSCAGARTTKRQNPTRVLTTSRENVRKDRLSLSSNATARSLGKERHSVPALRFEEICSN